MNYLELLGRLTTRDLEKASKECEMDIHNDGKATILEDFDTAFSETFALAALITLGNGAAIETFASCIAASFFRMGVEAATKQKSIDELEALFNKEAK